MVLENMTSTEWSLTELTCAGEGAMRTPLILLVRIDLGVGVGVGALTDGMNTVPGHLQDGPNTMDDLEAENVIHVMMIMHTKMKVEGDDTVHRICRITSRLDYQFIKIRFAFNLLQLVRTKIPGVIGTCIFRAHRLEPTLRLMLTMDGCQCVLNGQSNLGA